MCWRALRRNSRIAEKRAVALIVAAVLALAGMGALAASLLWREQAASMKQVEQTEGDYAGWAIEDKAALVRALVDSGYLAQGGETERLFDEGTPEAERHAIADALLLALTGQTEVAEISVDIITYAVMGAEDTWTPEERVWWQQVTRKFDGDDGADDTFLVPDDGVITEAEAVAAARAAILSAKELAPDALDAAQPVADLYVTQQQPDRPRWNVQFKLFREGSDSYVERVYSAVVDARSGEVCPTRIPACRILTRPRRSSPPPGGHAAVPGHRRHGGERAAGYRVLRGVAAVAQGRVCAGHRAKGARHRGRRRPRAPLQKRGPGPVCDRRGGV